MKAGTKLETTFDVYTIVKQIGGGGAGIVYECKNSDAETMALKILQPGLDRKKLKRFKNEIGFCQKDRHPGIIKIIDHGLLESGSEKSPFYVMPLYQGTLRQVIDGKILYPDLMELFLKILDGVEAAHLLGCIHRDLKPENILVDLVRKSVVIADFGIAHFSEEHLVTANETKQGERLANANYAAPEQRKRGAKIDSRADIFALGLILNEMFTREMPHGSQFKKVSEVNSDSAYIDEIIEQMISQDPEKRHRDIEALKSDLIKKGKISASFQKLDELKKTVIEEGEIDDPFIRNPVKVTAVDHTGREFILRLNHRVNALWTNVFYEAANVWTGMHWSFPDFVECFLKPRSTVLSIAHNPLGSAHQ